jgi:hypothetical protein
VQYVSLEAKPVSGGLADHAVRSCPLAGQFPDEPLFGYNTNLQSPGAADFDENGNHALVRKVAVFKSLPRLVYALLTLNFYEFQVRPD